MMQPSDSQNSENWTFWRCATAKLCPKLPPISCKFSTTHTHKTSTTERESRRKLCPYHTSSPKVMQNAFTTSNFSPPLKKIVPNGWKTAKKLPTPRIFKAKLIHYPHFKCLPNRLFSFLKTCPSPQSKLEGPFLLEIAALLAERVLQPCIKMTPKRAAIERTNCFQHFLKSREPLETQSPIKTTTTKL